MTALNFACGETRWEGFINSDIHGEEGTEIMDLTKIPYPYENDSAEVILMSHALFMGDRDGGPLHPDLEPIMAECHRVLQPGGWLRIDDNPFRCYDLGDSLDGWERDAEYERGYPDEFRMPRSVLRDLLNSVGFAFVSDVEEGKTLIPDENDVRYAILHNRRGRICFTIEAQK